MKSIANLIKKKGRNLLILNIILFALLGIYTYYIMTEDRTYSDLFKGTCEVHNIDDLEHCFNNNYYVRIHFDDVYSTNYGYYVDDVIKAYYIDLDLEGYSFITLVEESVANELFSDNNSITYIDGVITYFDEKEEHDGVIEGIKADYLSDFGEEFTAEDIDNMIIPIQMNAYQNPKNTNMVLLVILIGLGITTIIFMIKGLLMIIKPNEYKAFKKIENQDNLENEFENKVVYESKSIYLLPNYIIKENGFNIKIK